MTSPTEAPLSREEVEALLQELRAPMTIGFGGGVVSKPYHDPLRWKAAAEIDRLTARLAEVERERDRLDELTEEQDKAQDVLHRGCVDLRKRAEALADALATARRDERERVLSALKALERDGVIQFYDRGGNSPPGNMRRSAILSDGIALLRALPDPVARHGDAPVGERSE